MTKKISRLKMKNNLERIMASLSKSSQEKIANIFSPIKSYKLMSLAEELFTVGQILGSLEANETNEELVRQANNYKDFMITLGLYRDVLLQEFKRRDEVVNRLFDDSFKLIYGERAEEH